MNRLITALAGALLLLGFLPAPHASADVALDTCLANGRVAWDQVTDGNDLVCLGEGSQLRGSLGDDTYFWVEGSNAVYPEEGYADPGYDTLSLVDWTNPWVSIYAPPGTGFYDRIRYTSLNDQIGDPNSCNNLTASSDREFETGLGNDKVQCITGNIFTQGGDDTILGVTLDSSADAGAGVDYVTGDAGADLIRLGPGNDGANVDGGGADVVYGGDGTDRVNVGAGDATYQVESRY